ncbi:hypothetical protein B0I37DRAFT_399282 [Chaetomium sp. MPI-CAGE-AT-0009]|nr:hypothetical protein B0I37DRAFT_399282 [Chaetomium sp. MPI-CAGE-AT-0009]
MRRVPRLRAPVSAGIVPSSIPCGALRAPAAATIASTSTLPPISKVNNTHTRRYLSTTPIRSSQSKAEPQTEIAAEEYESYEQEYLPTSGPELQTQLVYPHHITTAPEATAVPDPSYKPAETAEGLEEVGGLAGWWDEPAHWGSEGGAAQYVQSVIAPFGPAERVTDPAVLEVLTKRAIVEALVVARFAGAEKKKAVDRLFAHAGGMDRLGKIVRAEIVAGQDGAATLKEAADWARVWDVLKSAVKMARQQQPPRQPEAVEQVEGEAVEAVVPEAEAKEAAPAPQLTPQVANSFVGTWNKEWKKAELRDPVVKFYAAKRILQLTGHRIPDGKLVLTYTIEGLLQHLIAPEKPKKLAELIEDKAVFKGLPNVRVFPRRVTPVDKEQMVGRWKLIVKELEKRELPVTGTGDYGAPIEKKWLEGRFNLLNKKPQNTQKRKRGAIKFPMALTPDKISVVLSGREGGEDDRTAQLKEVLAGLQKESDDGLAAFVEKLADGARDASWRPPLGKSGLLEFVLSTVPVKKGPQHPLNKQALRLIGNACADCDENRARVVSSGALRSFVMNIIEDPQEDGFLPFAIAAALNICVDYKPAQEQASEAGLSKVFIDLVSGDRLSSCQNSLSHIMTILELLCNQDIEPKVANPSTPTLLLSLATSEKYDADLDAFMEICAPALAYSTFQDFQPVLVKNGGIELLQLAFHQLYTRFDTADADPDTASQLKQTLVDWLASPTLPQLQTAACLALGNLSRSDESSTALLARVQEPILDILSRAIPPTLSQPRDHKAPAPPLQLTHAALHFLKNLAIPQANKPTLGGPLLDPVHGLLPRLWTSTRTQPQLQFTAVSLTRLLLANCPANIRHICTPTPTSQTADNNQSPSNLALLTSTAALADEEPIKIEAARAAGLVSRALHSQPTTTELLDPSWTWPTPTTPSTQTTTALTRFHTAHDTPTTTPSLRLLLTNTRFPALRSESIFALALMSRAGGEGARAALQVLQPPPQEPVQDRVGGGGGGAWQALAETITGSGSAEVEGLAGAFEAGGGGQEEEGDEDDGGVTVEKLSLEPQQVGGGLSVPGQAQPPPAQMAKMDRENGMVLVAELLRQFPEELSTLRRPLEAVLNRGAELVALDRDQDN